MKKIVFPLLVLLAQKAVGAEKQQGSAFEITQKVIVWDSDGTVVGPKNPQDPNDHTKIILPGVEAVMKRADFNCMISGSKSPGSKDYDPELLVPGFKDLMEKLPLQVIAFAPSADGSDCCVLIKKADGTIEQRKEHEEARFTEYRGRFKKPDTGMFVVLRAIAQEEFGYAIDASHSLMIGDSVYDEEGAHNFGIPFLHAAVIHESKLPRVQG